MIDKKDLLLQRGEDGKLLPQKVKLEALPDKPEVKIRPLTKGKLNEIFSLANSDNPADKIKSDVEIIKHGLAMDLTEDEIKDMKPSYSNAIAIAVMALSSGVSQEETRKKMEEVTLNEQASLKKK